MKTTALNVPLIILNSVIYTVHKKVLGDIGTQNFLDN